MLASVGQGTSKMQYIMAPILSLESMNQVLSSWMGTVGAQPPSRLSGDFPWDSSLGSGWATQGHSLSCLEIIPTSWCSQPPCVIVGILLVRWWVVPGFLQTRRAWHSRQRVQSLAHQTKEFSLHSLRVLPVPFDQLLTTLPYRSEKSCKDLMCRSGKKREHVVPTSLQL